MSVSTYTTPAGVRFLRRVWAQVTRTPNASIRRIASALGCAGSYSHVAAALRFLAGAGYITIERGKCARRVLVPLYT